ncbi:MAG TPA: hypothetical protein VHK69_06675 [Chitinophagaceae bacterium]|jgi:hypothetical protein|nr:hypothetical protein [Chitinophagaceae bacterium]
MDSQSPFSPQDSLLLIRSMIEKARANINENRFYFLLWGWIAFLAILGQFFLKVVLRYEHHYIVWLLTFVGIFASVFTVRRRARKAGARTYVGESMGNLWTGMGISFFVLSFLFMRLGWEHCYPFFILMYGLGTFVSGRILHFTPLVAGGITNWVLAMVAVYFSFDYQMLFAAAAIGTSYLIPGYMIKPSNTPDHA